MEAIVCDRIHLEMGPPQTTIWESPIAEFPGSRIRRIRRGYWLNGLSAVGLREAAVLRIFEQIYEELAHDHSS